MREFNLLGEYPSPEKPRYVGSNLRTINHRIVATYRDKNFFDGDRNFGYGGFKYDGRWKQVARNCVELFDLKLESNILHINCDFGFLLHDIKEINNTYNCFGTEMSRYAIDNSMKSIKDSITYTRPVDIDFKENFFNLTIALGVVYMLTLSDAINLLKKITYITKKNNSFITLATYSNDEDTELFNNWTLGGNLCLKREEWQVVFDEANYKGNCLFIDSNYLNLKFK